MMGMLVNTDPITDGIFYSLEKTSGQKITLDTVVQPKFKNHFRDFRLHLYFKRLSRLSQKMLTSSANDLVKKILMLLICLILICLINGYKQPHCCLFLSLIMIHYS